MVAVRELLADITSLQEDQEAIAATTTATLQDEELTLLGEIIAMIH